MKPRKITLDQMRAAREREVVIYCAGTGCYHSAYLNVDALPGNLSLTDLEGMVRCAKCGHRGADVRPLYWVGDHKPATKPWPAP